MIEFSHFWYVYFLQVHLCIGVCYIKQWNQLQAPSVSQGINYVTLIQKKSRFLVKTLLKWYPPIALMIPDIFQMVCNAIGKYETPSLHTASIDDLYT